MTSARTPHAPPLPTRSGRATATGLAWAARGLVLAGLLGLSVWNMTRSNALNEARAAEKRGDDPVALRDALDHLDRRPWSREAQRVAARCLSRLDFADLAEPHYRRGGPLSLEDKLTRAYGLTRANLRDRAEAAYREILVERPGDVTALRLLAGVLLSQARWDDLRVVAATLSALPTEPIEGYLPVTTKAGRWALKTVQVESPQAIGFTLKGSVHRDLHEIEPCAEALERVLDLDPDLRSMPLPKREFWTYLGEALVRSGRGADAVRRLGPVADELNDPALLDLLGQAHVLQGTFDDARRCFLKAIELGPDHLASWRDLGRLELQVNRPAEAVRALAEAETRGPGSYETAYGLALAYRRLGRENEARHYRDEAARLRRKLKPSAGGMGSLPGKPDP